MKILTINCGSSSIKYKFYSLPRGKLIVGGVIEHIGEKPSAGRYKNRSLSSHAGAMRQVFEDLLAKRAIKKLSEIEAVGHRVVHGGETFYEPHLITSAVIKKIKECSKFAPLHNPANLEGIKACAKALPRIRQVAVFDTAFHHSLPQTAYLYGLPYEYYRRYGIRKYGFHGTSHQFVTQSAARILEKPLRSLNLITCHLGNGCSIAAVKKGKSIDTSMGFTPLEGLIMGTRCGDIDPAAVLYLMEKGRFSTTEIDKILNKKSGLLGLSGISNDVPTIKKQMRKGSRRAQLAWEMFIYRIIKYIGAYWFVLGGADAICFTAGIGEHNPDLVSRIKKELKPVVKGYTKFLVVPTNEEQMIGLLTYNLIKSKTGKYRGRS